MGTDKAFVEVAGVPMVDHARRALVEAGAQEVLAIGGDGPRLEALGFDARPDTTPGEGPLGGIIDALAAASETLVMILACDQPDVDADLVRTIVGSFRSGDDAVVPIVSGRVQPLTACYSTHAHSSLRRSFDEGERAPRRALQRLRWRAARGVDPTLVQDVDDSGDLARYSSHVDSAPGDEDLAGRAGQATTEDD
jgi:molybdopterin-guanine dinucleotide biosynthesis protein A